MKTRKYTAFVKMLAFVLALTIAVPIYAGAAVIEPAKPDASYYLTSYGAYVGALGGGDVNIYFSATGTSTMDQIGAKRVVIEESVDGTNWYGVATYHYSSSWGMVGSGVTRHNSSVPYDGVAGRYYRGYVTIWASKNGGSDTRYVWTSSVRAT